MNLLLLIFLFVIQIILKVVNSNIRSEINHLNLIDENLATNEIIIGKSSQSIKFLGVEYQYLAHLNQQSGDFNGDGISDLLIKANNDNNNAIDSSVYCIFGTNTTLQTNVEIDLSDGFPSSNYEGFVITNVDLFGDPGKSVDFCDINGDNLSDIIIGAAAELRVYVIYGTKNIGVTSIDVNVYLNGETGFYLTHTDYDFGMTLGCIKNLNNDSYSDFAIGLTSYDVSTSSNEGSTFIIKGGDDINSGATEITALSLINGNDGIEIIGSVFSGQMGGSIANAGDINNDGFDDVLIGSYNSNYKKVVIIFGQSFPYSQTSFDDDNIALPGFVITSEDGGFGKDVSGNVDFNNDGFSDFIVGDNVGDGAVYVYYGQETFATKSYTDKELTYSKFSGTYLYGDSNFGQLVHAISDINNDGYDDFLVGAQGDHTHGAVYLIFNKPSYISQEITITSLVDNKSAVKFVGESGGDRLGNYGLTAFDFNNDNYLDLMFCSFFHGNTNSNGACYVYFTYSDSSNSIILEGIENKISNGKQNIIGNGNFNTIEDSLQSSIINGYSNRIIDSHVASILNGYDSFIQNVTSATAIGNGININSDNNIVLSANTENTCYDNGENSITMCAKNGLIVNEKNITSEIEELTSEIDELKVENDRLEDQNTKLLNMIANLNNTLSLLNDTLNTIDSRCIGLNQNRRLNTPRH